MRAKGAGSADALPSPDASATPAEVVARLGGVDHAFQCPAGVTLLDAALDAGVSVPCSCREGHCGACMTTLKEGAVEQATGSALSRRDRLKGRILACRSVPVTPNILIDYDA